jgi:dGTP triphosphohydrolase
MRLLHGYYSEDRSAIQGEYQDDERAVVDYVAGMTDRYAIRVCESIQPGVAKGLQRATPL